MYSSSSANLAGTELKLTVPSNKAIARALGIVDGTVKAHLHKVFKKLGVGDRVQLALGFQQENPSPSRGPSAGD